MRILIAAENASLQMSGEAALALYYFDRLRERHLDVWMVCHNRVRDELRQRYDDETFNRIYFVKDTSLQSKLCVWTNEGPLKNYERIVGQIVRLITQINTRPIVQRLVKTLNIDLVFDPSIISPKSLSCLYDLDVPVVIGPMCGGIEFPPNFRYLEPFSKRFSTQLGRWFSQITHRMFPGKLKAAALLVANDRTARALPKGYQGKVHTVVESGVDLTLWQPIARPPVSADRPVRFVYMARFVEQKGIPFLIRAFKTVAEQTDAVLELIGSGELYDEIKAQVAEFNIQDQVNFYGWMQLKDAAALIRECDVYLVPAIGDCGGCAMLEAMAMGLPVIAANWAGREIMLTTPVAFVWMSPQQMNL
ncbi:glycosyltransferase family 4 protein [Egbenema bharatensis]|uniref:glycosyltransferase family 4 protein n=1 Tax=Egbenema bharatensis TaxID=3463334 RepID=UPI003A876543